MRSLNGFLCGGGLAAMFACALLATPASNAQIGFASPAAPANPKAAAPIDLTGYWVSIVTEDWRYRMITPDKDEAAGEQCKSYGAGAIMRVPTRLHVSWDNDTTLRVETDAGKQIRLFHFGVSEPPQGEAPSWQGYSAASWEG